jgi:hypothetical protein
MPASNDTHKPFRLGGYTFCEPRPISIKDFLPFPGVYALYSKNRRTGYLKLRYVGESQHLEQGLTLSHPVLQSLLVEAHGNKELLFYTYHINFTETERTKIAQELIQNFKPPFNQKGGVGTSPVQVSYLQPSEDPLLLSSFDTDASPLSNTG